MLRCSSSIALVGTRCFKQQQRFLSSNHRAQRLVQHFRNNGHNLAQVDPLKTVISEGDRSNFLNEIEQQHEEFIEEIAGVKHDSLTLEQLSERLEYIYCSGMAIETLHMPDEDASKKWFINRFEQLKFEQLDADRAKELSKLMLASESMDQFMANKFPTVKRYSGEGCESMMVVFDEIFRACSDKSGETSDVIMCMPHRGRLNALACLLDYPAVQIFRKMSGLAEFPSHVHAWGDVLSHLSTSLDLQYGSGRKVHVNLIPNPSHLEANNPVALGKARARLQSRNRNSDGTYFDNNRRDVLCVQVHGDASFAGQGIVAETFNLSKTRHFSANGSIHLIVNNQIGFTTQPNKGRSTKYASDTAKITNTPIIHVNADYVEDVWRATRLAFEFREKFGEDVIIDLNCFRRHGHNEVDDPTVTQPLMYKAIRERDSIPRRYANTLLNDGRISQAEIDSTLQTNQEKWKNEFGKIHSYEPSAPDLMGYWTGLSRAGKNLTTWDTGMDESVLKYVAAKSVEYPANFNVHPNVLKSHIETRIKKLRSGEKLDWATAEAMAIGSLMLQGYDVRLSGQDVGRGTFSHRHQILYDYETNEEHMPMKTLFRDGRHENPRLFEVCESILSEEAVLGFEYGASIENPSRLVIWEAQFGDFFNGAQTIIDTFVTSGETKWLLQSSLVMLLPHGYDGAGPDHSSCRIERFLQMSDSCEQGQTDSDRVNFEVCNPTTSAQYFHLLRRQMLRDYRKPLVIASPKALLRSALTSSNLGDMLTGTHFKRILSDPDASKAEEIKKILFCSGKHYFTLKEHMVKNGISDVAVIRVESLSPFPAEELIEVMKKFSKAKEFIWAQEEPRNQGAWSFVSPRFENLVGKKLRYAGRPELPLCAVGFSHVHKEQCEGIIRDAFE